MIRTVSAEFQSIDDAEFAAKRIKSSCEGVSKISIKSKEINNPEKIEYNPFGHVGFSNSSVSGTFVPYDLYYYGIEPLNYAMNEFNDNFEDNRADTVEQSQSVRLEIHCDNDNTGNVTGILHSMGGTDIKKI